MDLSQVSTFHLAVLRAQQASRHTLAAYSMVEQRYLDWPGELGG